MRRSLVVSLALLAMISAPAVAQTCMGLASYSTGRMQASGNGSFTNGANTFGGSLGYGLPGSAFGNATLSTTSYDAANASSVGIGANVGYQLALGQAAQVQLCPVAGFEVGNGPDDNTAGINASSRSATVGFSLGTSMGANPRMKITPAAGLGLVYGKVKLQDTAGLTTESSDTYGMAHLNLGFVFNQNIAVRPSVAIPLGLNNSDPTFGLTLGYNFGRTH